MKTKMTRKALRVKLIHTLSEYVKSVIDVDSKKISKSIKKAGRIVAKAVTKEINASEALNPIKEKPFANRRIVKKQTKAKAIKRLSLPRVINKVNKDASGKFSQKTQEETLGFAGKDGQDKSSKKV